MGEICYGVIESVYKIEDGKLIQAGTDTVFEYSVFGDKEVAINKVKEEIKNGGDEVTSQIPEDLLEQLPKVDEDLFEFYDVVKMRNVILTYKVIKLNIVR